jgi:hypothetical protein
VNGASTNWLLLGVAISSDDTHSLTDNKELTGFYAINSFVVAFKKYCVDLTHVILHN